MAETNSWYDANAKAVSERYESVSSERVHGWMKHLLPAAPATVLDVGAGSGRDAAWLSKMTHDVVATYKLGLLRVLCRIAEGAAGLSWEADDDHVAVPMGLVALTWIRLYKPLLRADLPQNPLNRGCNNLGFANEAFQKLDAVSHHDLRVGMCFSGEVAGALHRAIKDAARTIVDMPARYMKYPNGALPILPVHGPVTKVTAGRVTHVRLDEEYLTRFGSIHVPTHLWAAVQRFSAWIEPALDCGVDSIDEVLRGAAGPAGSTTPESRPP